MSVPVCVFQDILLSDVSNPPPPKTATPPASLALDTRCLALPSGKQRWTSQNVWIERTQGAAATSSRLEEGLGVRNIFTRYGFICGRVVSVSATTQTKYVAPVLPPHAQVSAMFMVVGKLGPKQIRDLKLCRRGLDEAEL